MKKKKVKHTGVVICTLIQAGNMSFDAPASTGSGNFTGGNGTTDAGTLEVDAEVFRGTTGVMTTAAATTFTATITNNQITANSVVIAQISGYTGAGWPSIESVVAGNGTATVNMVNADASDALDAAIRIDFVVHQLNTKLVVAPLP